MALTPEKMRRVAAIVTLVGQAITVLRVYWPSVSRVIAVVACMKTGRPNSSSVSHTFANIGRSSSLPAAEVGMQARALKAVFPDRRADLVGRLFPARPVG